MTEQEQINKLREELSVLRSNYGMVEMLMRATMRAAKMPVEDGPDGLTMKDLPRFVGDLRTERDRLFKKCGKPASG